MASSGIFSGGRNRSSEFVKFLDDNKSFLFSTVTQISMDIFTDELLVRGDDGDYDPLLKWKMVSKLVDAAGMVMPYDKPAWGQGFKTLSSFINMMGKIVVDNENKKERTRKAEECVCPPKRDPEMRRAGDVVYESIPQGNDILVNLHNIHMDFRKFDSAIISDAMFTDIKSTEHHVALGDAGDLNGIEGVIIMIWSGLFDKLNVGELFSEVYGSDKFTKLNTDEYSVTLHRDLIAKNADFYVHIMKLIPEGYDGKVAESWALLEGMIFSGSTMWLNLFSTMTVGETRSQLNHIIKLAFGMSQKDLVRNLPQFQFKFSYNAHDDGRGMVVYGDPATGTIKTFDTEIS